MSALRTAIEAGDLAAVRRAAKKSRPSLHDALDILRLIAGAEPQSFDRAAARWIGRLALERRVGLEDLDAALDACADPLRFDLLDRLEARDSMPAGWEGKIAREPPPSYSYKAEHGRARH